MKTRDVLICFSLVLLQAQIVLLGILLIAIVNFMIGSVIPSTPHQKSQGFLGYRGKLFYTFLIFLIHAVNLSRYTYTYHVYIYQYTKYTNVYVLELVCHLFNRLTRPSVTYV